MSEESTKGFLFSATLHGAVAALMFFSFVMKREVEPARVFELVAGEGDNYMAKEAPALGNSDGVKLAMPKAAEPKPSPPEPVPQETVRPPTPTPPAPTPKAVTPTPQKTATPDVPDFKKKLRRDLNAAESKVKRDIKKERDAEAKKAAEDAKKNTLTKEEFDRTKAKANPSTNKTSPPKVAKIDAEGIAKGVVGGSTANKKGGAGGKALTTDNVDVMLGYDALFKQRLRAEFEPPPGLSDSLKVDIEVRSNADGSLSGARVVKTSGSSEFDRAVLEALRRVRMPPRPDKKSDAVEFTFTMRERTEG